MMVKGLLQYLKSSMITAAILISGMFGTLMAQSLSYDEFFNYLDLEYPGLELVGTALSDGDTSLAKHELLVYFQQREGRQFHNFLGSGSIPDANLNVDGYFTEVGHTQNVLNENGTINWSASWSQDTEWHWQFHRMNWLVNMARVYRNTEDKVYAETWIFLITDWIKNNEPGYPRTLDTGNRLRNWVESYQNMIHVTKSEHITPEDHALMLKSMMEQVLFLRDNWRDIGNWGASETRGMGQVVAMFPEFTFSAETDWDDWKDLVLQRVAHHLTIDYRPDGVQIETSPMYHALEFRNLLQTYSLLEMNGVTISDTLVALFERPAEVMKQVTKPDGNYVMIGSTDQDSYLNRYLRRAGELFDRQDFIYVATTGDSGEPAVETFKLFPYGGLGIMRDTWGHDRQSFRNSKYLLFNFTTNEPWHSHFDMMSIEAYANGRTILIDPGRYSYNPTWRAQFKSSQSHSTIVVNDRNQQMHVHGFAEGYAQPGFQYIDGHHDGFPFDVKHRRKILFVKPDYWIVSDLLTGSGEHTYDQYFHFEPFYRTRHDVDPVTGAFSTPDFALVPAEENRGEPEMLSGYVSYSYGEKSQSPVIRYKKGGGLPETFETVIYPFDDGQQQVSVNNVAVFTAEGDSLGKGDGVAIHIVNDTFSDMAWLSHGVTGAVYYDKFETDGKTAFARISSSGTAVSYHLNEGTRLVYDHLALVALTGGDGTVSWNGETVTIDGENVLDATLFVPYADKVVLNGIEVDYARDGDRISLSGDFVATEEQNELPEGMALHQNYPNPFNSTTRIPFDISGPSDIQLEVFDALGRSVGVLVNERRNAGSYQIPFDASGLASGVYFIRLSVDGVYLTNKMTLVK
jgi:hypothetical protein